MHVDLGLTDSCVESDRMLLLVAWAGWAVSMVFDWTFPLDPRTRAYWATPEQSE